MSPAASSGSSEFDDLDIEDYDPSCPYCNPQPAEPQPSSAASASASPFDYQAVNRALRQVEFNTQIIVNLLKGRKVRILPSSTFNGQPIGRSRPKLAGKEFIVKYVFVEPQMMNGAAVALSFGDAIQASIALDEVEVVD